MKTKLLKELPLILIALAPTMYLAFIWTSLPAETPMQYDFDGTVSRYGSKTELLIASLVLPLLMYGILLVIPALDPKKKILQMGKKYTQLKFILVVFMSVLAAYLIYESGRHQASPPNAVFFLIGLLFAVLGNYFPSLRPNYFIGIRTPWTLENETVWRDTHRLGGRIWLVTGLLLAVLSTFLPPEAFPVVFIAAIAIMALVPIVYSYFRFKAVKTGIGED